MSKLVSVIGLSVLGFACQRQEPAAAPLAPPPPAAPEMVAAPPAPAEPPKPEPLSPEQMVKVYQDCWASFNAKDWDKFAPCYAETATSERVDSGMPPLSGRTAILDQGSKPWTAAFPDGTGEHQLTLVNGRQIASVVLFRGNHQGALESPRGEIKPTNKKVGMLLVQQLELGEDGRSAVRERLVMDAGTLLGQLGQSPQPHRKAMDTGWAEKPVVIAANNELEKANLAAVRQAVEALNKHDVTALMAGVADDVVFSDLAAAADRTGKKEVQKSYEELFKGFPDVKIELKNAWAAGDYVVSEGVLSGTNTGDMPSMKLKKTGKSLSVHFLQIDKLQGGKIKNSWVFSNGLAFASQLGLLPQPKGEAKPGAAPPAAPPPAAPPAKH
jgi:hypothetical protein